MSQILFIKVIIVEIGAAMTEQKHWCVTTLRWGLDLFFSCIIFKQLHISGWRMKLFWHSSRDNILIWLSNVSCKSYLISSEYAIKDECLICCNGLVCGTTIFLNISIESDYYRCWQALQFTSWPSMALHLTLPQLIHLVISLIMLQQQTNTVLIG